MAIVRGQMKTIPNNGRNRIVRVACYYSIRPFCYDVFSTVPVGFKLTVMVTIARESCSEAEDAEL